MSQDKMPTSDTQKPSRSEVVALARSYLGTRWRHQGRSRNGIDCVGLIVVVAKELKISEYDYTRYGRRSFSEEFLHHFANNMKQKSVNEISDGDVVVFRDGAFPCHCGFISTDQYGRRSLIHAHARHREVQEDVLDEYWFDKMAANFEFKEVADG